MWYTSSCAYYCSALSTTYNLQPTVFSKLPPFKKKMDKVNIHVTNDSYEISSLISFTKIKKKMSSAAITIDALQVS